jgi:hypothetical protein
MAVVAAIGAIGAPASAQPARVTYQGYLTDSGGDPVTDTADLFFRMYPTASGGTPVWNETIPDVDIAAGSFSVELSIDASDLVQQDLWLAVAVGSASAELPRMRVGSVPFAIEGGDTTRLGGVDAADYQRRVAGTCLADQAIVAVQDDGTVMCEDDDAMGVGGVVAGVGLIEVGTAVNSVLEVVAGEGTMLIGDQFQVAFSGSGSIDQVARSDHHHDADFLARGTDLTCSGGDKVVALDVVTGDVSCAPDANPTYTASNGLFVAPEGFVYDFVLDAPDSLTRTGFVASNYYLFPQRTHLISLDASDFEPDYSSFSDYFAAPGFGGRLTGFGPVRMFAPVSFPQGAEIGVMYLYYQNPNSAADDLFCGLISVDLTTGAQTGGAGLGGETPGPGVQMEAGNFGWTVDNGVTAYTAFCDFSDQGGTFGDVRLVGIAIEYHYSELAP